MTKEEYHGYQKIGETKSGEAVYKTPNGAICVEKDYTRLVLATLKEIEEATGKTGSQ